MRLTWSIDNPPIEGGWIQFYSVLRHKAFFMNDAPVSQDSASGDASYPASPGRTFFAVFAADGMCSGYSQEVDGSKGGESVPVAPTNVHAFVDTHDASSDPSTNEVRLVWDDRPDDESEYRIYRRDPSQSEQFEEVATVSPDVDEWTDKGMRPGNYDYRVVSANSAGLSNDPPSENPNSDAPGTTVGVWPAGALVAFDGTWDMQNFDGYHQSIGDMVSRGSPWQGSTVIPIFSDLYQQSEADYFRGVGNALDYPSMLNQDIQAITASDAMKNVAAALLALGSYYHSALGTDPKAEQHVPVDLIGYSRGAMQAVKLANVIAKSGIPDPTTRVVTPHTFLRPHGTTVTYDVVSYTRHFHPTIRFVGLVSPVYMSNILSDFSSIASFGMVELDGGWPSTLPASVKHVVILHDSNPNLPPFVEKPVHRAGGDGANDSSSGLSYDHPTIGVVNETLIKLGDAANAVNVPIPRNGGRLNLVTADGRVHSWGY